MFGGVKIYTVHVKPQDKGVHHKPVFVKEGFNFAAFVLPLLWALYKRLWIPAVLIGLFDLAFIALMTQQILAQSSLNALDLTFRVLVGYQANDWLRACLNRQGYVMSDISAADSLLRAEQRYFERYLAASAPRQ